jgi:hypothetical protein
MRQWQMVSPGTSTNTDESYLNTRRTTLPESSSQEKRKLGMHAAKIGDRCREEYAGDKESIASQYSTALDDWC